MIIGDGIRVKVLSVQGNQVRLGFVAPRSVTIHRQELLQHPAPDAVIDGPSPKA
ncbi:MAG: carbon storage regulator [Gemmataceae bacterium]